MIGQIRKTIIFLLIFSWIFFGFPQAFNFPLKTQEAQATTGLNIAKGTLLVPSATGQQTITTGFEVKAVFFWVSDHSTTGSFQANAAMGYGFATGTGVGNQYAVAVQAYDNVTKNEAKPRFQNDAAILMITDAKPGVVTLEANIFESFTTTATGFKLDWVTVNANVVVHYMAIGGSDIGNVATGNFTAGATSGNIAITGVGFQPDYVQFLSDGKATTFPGTGGKSLSIGHAISSTNRDSISEVFKAQPGRSGKAGRSQRSLAYHVEKGNATETEIDFVSMDTDGFTLNVTKAKKDHAIAYFAIKGVNLNVALGTETQNTTTGTKATTGLGFQPEAIVFYSFNNTATTASVADASYTIGGSDGTNEDSLWAGNEDNPTNNTNADTYINTTKAIMMGTPGATPTLDAEANLSSFDSDGFTLDWTTADATARQFIYWAIGGTDPAPNAPSQDSPTNGATGVSVTPTFTMTATDAHSDNLSYKVTIYSNSACTAVVQTHDQAVTSTGWSGTDATCANAPANCYASGTQGNFTVQSGDALSASTQYWWKASAKDPDGSGTFTDSATCNSFTTAAGAAPTLTFSISDNTIGFGTLSATAARFANGVGTGSATEVEAHNLIASTNATNGYTITVNGNTLTSNNGDTITAIGGTNVASSPGTEQFGLRITATGGNGTVSVPYAASGFALDTAAFPDQIASDPDGDDVSTTYSVRYLANITAQTEAGSYTATLTYIIAGNF